MAEFNQLLEQSYNRALKAMLGLDEAPGVSSVSPELWPVLAFPDQPDLAYLLGWRRGGGVGVLPIVAGQVNHHAIVNPVDSGVIAIAWIDEIFNTVAAGAFVQLAVIRDTTLGIPVVSASRAGLDTRQVFVSGGNLVCTVESQAAGAALTPNVAFKRIDSTVAATPRRYGPYIVTPGFGVMVFSSDEAAGQFTAASFEWFERKARPSELQPEA